MSENLDPFSDIKRGASVMWDLYEAFLVEGFSAEQAFTLTRDTLKAQTA